MKFRLLLWLLGLLMKRASRKNQKFIKKLEGQDLTFQISSQDGPVRHYVVKDQQVSSHSGQFASPAFEIAFASADAGFKTLTAKNAQLAFMKGIQNKQIVISGDYTKAIWFQSIVKYLVPK
ncbi:helicase [Candidatus Sororendozoicomonas aggregata]|uniref:helicase n=1 Tax=Candidatus Sororendozoicomonas aggregata TaxID=3073239 RepID=UPI002ED2C7BB